MKHIDLDISSHTVAEAILEASIANLRLWRVMKLGDQSILVATALPHYALRNRLKYAIRTLVRASKYGREV